MVLIAVLVVGTFGGIVSLWDTPENRQSGITGVEFDGDPPSDPDGGIPSGDPEHPQGGGG
ncbi:MAG: hypothetical protein AYK18_00640 [Theionarchaea archaeon DG-70]|nr:MAG: hypothetical protein AYK18_00640 [Theionarchaea archaeon DG-70]